MNILNHASLYSGTTNGTGTSARFWGSNGICVDSLDYMYVTENNGRIRKGMVVLIQGGAGSDTYFNQKIKSIEIDGSIVESTPKATENNPFDVWINVDEGVRPNKIDHIYIFTEKTYKHRMSKKPKKKKADYYKL